MVAMSHISFFVSFSHTPVTFLSHTKHWKQEGYMDLEVPSTGVQLEERKEERRGERGRKELEGKNRKVRENEMEN
jgi:hypothetical protein